MYARKRKKQKRYTKRDMPIVYYSGQEEWGFKPQIGTLESNVIPLFLKSQNKNTTNHYALGSYPFNILKQMIAFYHQHNDIFHLAIKYVKTPANEKYYDHEEDIEKAIELIYQLGYDHLNPECNPDLVDEGEEAKPIFEPVEKPVEEKVIEIVLPKKKPYNSKTPLYKLKAIAKTRKIRGFSRMNKEELLEILKKTEKN